MLNKWQRLFLFCDSSDWICAALLHHQSPYIVVGLYLSVCPHTLACEFRGARAISSSFLHSQHMAGDWHLVGTEETNITQPAWHPGLCACN